MVPMPKVTLVLELTLTATGQYEPAVRRIPNRAAEVPVTTPGIARPGSAYESLQPIPGRREVLPPQSYRGRPSYWAGYNWLEFTIWINLLRPSERRV